ncbi:hypothetical protein HOE04_01810 [archaeon]|jgi:hypothetical protein|nr:hypothetical protein [archaeon]
MTREYLKDNYSIQIFGTAGYGGRGLDIHEGECCVYLYQSLDKGHGDPPVQHIVKRDAFKLEDIDSLNPEQFMDKIRNTIKQSHPEAIGRI